MAVEWWGPGINEAELQLAFEIARVGMRPHYVYFVAAQDDSYDTLVKIGTSTSVSVRMQQIARDIQNGPDWLKTTPDAELCLLGYVVGDQELERQLHKAFKAHRAGGEWFWYKPLECAIDDLLCENCVCEPCIVVDRLSGFAPNVPWMRRADAS